MKKISQELREWIEARVVEDENGCWIWQLAFNNGKPQGRYRRKTIRVRRTIWEQQHERSLPPTWFAVCKHGTEACANPQHTIGQKRGIAQQGRPLGVAHRAAIAQGCRSVRKLREDDVAAIRASAEHQSVLAQRYGVSETYVQQLRANVVWRDYANPFAGLFTGLVAANSDNTRRAA